MKYLDFMCTSFFKIF